METNQPRKKQPKSLTSLLKYFIGLEITVELKTGKQVVGVLSACDNVNMNLTLEDAQVVSRRRSEDQSTFAFMQIRGSTLRYIHFPDDLHLSACIKQGMDRERSAVQKYQRGKRK